MRESADHGVCHSRVHLRSTNDDASRNYRTNENVNGAVQKPQTVGRTHLHLANDPTVGIRRFLRDRCHLR